MKLATLLLVALVSVGLMAGNALAFSCPSLQKAANESIQKAEANAAKTTGDREKARAIAMVEEAKALEKASEESHKGGQHAKSEAQAKAAKALADMVQ
jgi:3-deoxy-D-manno-octulosonic acid (KDO) 8-phosphate synthase